MGYLSCKVDSAVSTVPSVRKSAVKSGVGRSGSDPRHFTHGELETATSGFSDTALLGRGSHGSVFLASLPSGELLAVKRPSRPHSSEVLNEISVLSRIRSPSPRLVNLVGLTPSPPPLLVLEYMPNGSLFDLLHSPSRSPPSWSLRLRLALQSAGALLFLHSHSPPVLHRDVKSANVLLDSKLNARLADFGLAVFAAPGGPRLTPPAGTLGYLDPAYVTPEKLSTKTDVFSFGILLLEIISGRKAFDVTHSPPSILDWALPLVRRGKVLALFDPRIPPPRDPIARRQLAALAASCVRSSRDRRPSIEEVAECLKVLRSTVPSHRWHVRNPCSAIETVHRAAATASNSRASKSNSPLESSDASFCSVGSSTHRSEEDDVDVENAPIHWATSLPSLKSSRNASRVFSESSSRNLMQLMKEPNKEILRYRSSGVVLRNDSSMWRARSMRDCDNKVDGAFEDLSIWEEKDAAAAAAGGGSHDLDMVPVRVLQ